MKKYIFLFFTIVASSLLFPACNDQLDLQSDGRISMDQIFSDRYKTMGYLNSCYGYSPTPYMDRSSFCDEAEDGDDNTPGSRYNAWYTGSITASSFPAYSVDGGPWPSLYDGIRKCNVFLANVWISTASATNEEKEGWAAQAHTLRALYYLQLIKRYGDVPIFDKPLELNHDFSKDTKSKFSTVVKFIMADCDSALKAPASQSSFPWNIYTNQYGIMSRAIPYAIKSEAITYAASPLWSDGTYSWADATKVNADALYQCLTHDYSLYNLTPSPTIAQNAYAQYFITNFADDYQRTQDKETIYQGGGRMSVWYNAGLPSTPGMGKSGPCPTQDLVDSYEMANGEIPITGYSDATHLQPIINPASGYDPANPYVGRDPRFYASIYYNGAPRYLDAATAGMKFIATAPFYGIEVLCPSWGNNIGNLTLSLYKWDANYPASVAGVPVAQGTFVNFNDGQNLVLTFNSPLPAGNYVWELSNGTETVGVWKWTDGTSSAISYYNGVQTDGNYRSQIAYAQNIFTPLVTGAANQTPVGIAHGEKVASYVGGADEILQTNRTHTKTSYYLRKFNNYKSALNNEADGAVRMFRLGELYMNFAESAYQSVDPDAKITLGSGMVMSALDAVNAIRARAGMPALPGGMSKDAFQIRYRNERRIEFAFEEQRYFDVRRWKILSQTDKIITGMRIVKDNSGNLTYSRFKFNDRNCVSDKWLLYPISQNDVTKVIGTTGVNWQNPGWQ